MRTSVAALAIAAALATPALAQNMNNTNPGSPTNAPNQAATSMAPATQPPGTTAAPGTTTGPAASQTRPGTATSGPMGSTAGTTTTTTAPAAGGMMDRAANRGTDTATAPATRSETNGVPVTTTPASGANSFTEGQARSRIEAAGFTGVQDLRKDEAGVWRGRAMRGGQTAEVGLDFQGNVVTGNAPAR